jgi:hypothetical protein
VDDPGFVAVVGELRRWVRNLSRPENTRSPELGAESSEGDSRGEEIDRAPERRIVGIMDMPQLVEGRCFREISSEVVVTSSESIWRFLYSAANVDDVT